MSGPNGMVSAPNVRNDPPTPDDYGQVTRPILDGITVETEPVATTGALSPVAADVTPVEILTANADRQGFTVTNDSATATLYLKCASGGGPVSSSNYTVKLTPGAYYEDPYRYVGAVTGLWSAAVGQALVTEYS